MIEYAKGRIYPNSVPEFRHLQKSDGKMEMQVRYINAPMGYTGKWMPVNTVQEDTNRVEDIIDPTMVPAGISAQHISKPLTK